MMAAMQGFIRVPRAEALLRSEPGHAPNFNRSGMSSPENYGTLLQEINEEKGLRKSKVNRRRTRVSTTLTWSYCHYFKHIP